MIKFSSGLDMFLWNLLIVGIWHVCIFIACIKFPKSTFDPSREKFRPKAWEHGGKWYKEKLKIQTWKDKVPQFIGKDGFSKQHFTDVSIDYLDQFIFETCRGEWTHRKNCASILITLLINPLIPGIFFSFLILLGNVPFALIQRYNRFRLQTLRKKLLRGMGTANVNSNTVTA